MKKLALAITLLCAALPASASIALFTDGRSMKISGFRLIDQNAIQLTFKNGGAMTMPLNRIPRSGLPLEVRSTHHRGGKKVRR